MKAKQLSVFLENKSGRLTEVTEALGAAGVNLSAMSIADNSDFGILRCVVSDPEDHRRDRLYLSEHRRITGHRVTSPVRQRYLHRIYVLVCQR